MYRPLIALALSQRGHCYFLLQHPIGCALPTFRARQVIFSIVSRELAQRLETLGRSSVSPRYAPGQPGSPRSSRLIFPRTGSSEPRSAHTLRFHGGGGRLVVAGTERRDYLPSAWILSRFDRISFDLSSTIETRTSRFSLSREFRRSLPSDATRRAPFTLPPAGSERN